MWGPAMSAFEKMDNILYIFSVSITGFAAKNACGMEDEYEKI
jgi:hypothetical protein